MLTREFSTVVTVVVLLAALPFAQAATVTWDNGGANGNWATNTNWSDDTNGVATNDIAVFNDTAIGTNTMNETSPFSLNTLTYANTSGTQTTDLGGSQLNTGTINVGLDVTGSAAVIRNGTFKPTGDVYIYVGRRSSVANPSGTLTIGSAATTTVFDSSTTTNRFMIGDNGGAGTLDLRYATFDVSGAKTLQANAMYLGQAYGYLKTGSIILPESDKLTLVKITSQFTLGLGGGTGQLGSVADATRLPDGVSLQLGTSTASRLGTALLGRGGWGNPGTGILTMGTGSTFTGYLGQLWVGWTDTAGLTTGTLDLRNAAIGNGGTFDVNDLVVGSGANGKLLFSSATGAGQLTNFYVNTNLGIGLGSAGLSGRIGTGATGDGDLPAGVNFRLGTSTSSRAAVNIGIDGDSPGSNGRMSLGANSTFQGYVSELKVGYPTAGYHVSTGLLDLRRATLTGAGLDVSTAVRVGAGAGGGAGSLYLGPSPNPTTVAKSPLVQVGQASGGTGLLDLTGTIFQITGSSAKSLDIRATGDTVTHVAAASSGFDITNSTSTVFNIDTGGLMRILFENPCADRSAAPFWGLRMAGDQQTLFTTYIGANNSSSRIWYSAPVSDPAAWTTLGLYYDTTGNYTYIGLPIPEPASSLLLLLAAATGIARRRQTKR